MTFFAISLFTLISCANNQDKNNHEHSHGPNGEHLDEGTHDHVGNTQEIFMIKEDSINIDSLKIQDRLNTDHKQHSHSDEHVHSH